MATLPPYTSVELFQKISQAESPQQINALLADQRAVDFLSIPCYSLPFQDRTYNLSDKKAATYQCSVAVVQLTNDNLEYWRRGGNQGVLSSKYIAFWIQPALFAALSQKVSGLERRATVQAKFGFSTAYNQKLGLNYNGTFNSPHNGQIGGFINANMSQSARIGLLPKQTVASFKPKLLEAQSFWADTKLGQWITRALQRYEGPGIELDQMKGYKPAEPVDLPVVDVPAKTGQNMAEIQGEYHDMLSEMQMQDEYMNATQFAVEEDEMYGAEGYSRDRHSGFGSVLKNVGKTMGRVGIGIGRVIEPEFKPLYDIGDRALDNIKGQRLGQDPATWGPVRGTEYVTRDMVESQHPQLAQRDVYQRFRKQAADDGAHVYDKSGNEVMSKMATVLPEIMAQVASQIDGEPEAEWAMSLISPFNAGSKGARVPVVQTTKTVTATAYSDLGAFNVDIDKQALVFSNFTSLNQEPWMLINSLPTTCQLAPPQVVQVSANSIEPGLTVPNVFYTGQYLSLGTTDLAIIQNIVMGDKPGTEGIFASVKLAAAGLRYFKTSASTNESGVIKAIYQDRGAAVTKNLAQLMNYFQDDDTHVRVYTAANTMATSMGKTGFLLQANYQPINLRECQDFVDSRSLTISNVTKLANGQWAQLNHIGPVRLLVEFDTPPDDYDGRTWNPDQFYLLDATIQEAVAASATPVVLSEFGLDGYSLAQPHITIQAFEGISTASTFELQMVQHFEGIPSSSSQFLETKSARLGIDYATPLDIMRHFRFSDFMVGDGMLMNDPNMMVVRGEGDAAALALAFTAMQPMTKQELTDQANLNPSDLVSLIDPHSRMTLKQRNEFSDILHSGYQDTIAGKFLSKAGSIAQRAMNYLKRNKTVKNLLMGAVPKIVDIIGNKIGLSERTKDQVESLAKTAVEHHMQGELEPVAEDLSGRYKIEANELQILQGPNPRERG